MSLLSGVLIIRPVYMKLMLHSVKICMKPCLCRVT